LLSELENDPISMKTLLMNALLKYSIRTEEHNFHPLLKRDISILVTESSVK
jgi:hypothetical protein